MTRKHNERFRGRTDVTVFGRRAVLEALASDLVDVQKVMVARSEPAAFRSELSAACAARGVTLDLGSAQDVSNASGQPRNDQGVVARVELRGVTDLETYLAPLRGNTPARLLALDNVTNPQNVGMIVRSVVASGVGAMLWPMAGSPWISGLLIKASASSIYQCRIVTTPTLAEGLVALRRAGFSTFGLDADGGASLFEHKAPTKAAYVVGGETEGLSPSVRESLDQVLAIPMAGGIDSLNVAVAASLVCFSVTRGHEASR